MEQYDDRRRRGGSGQLVAWLALAVVVLGAFITFYGQFQVQQNRIDELDQRLQEISRRCYDLERRVDQYPTPKQ